MNRSISALMLAILAACTVKKQEDSFKRHFVKGEAKYLAECAVKQLNDRYKMKAELSTDAGSHTVHATGLTVRYVEIDLEDTVAEITSSQRLYANRGKGVSNLCSHFAMKK